MLLLVLNLVVQNYSYSEQNCRYQASQLTIARIYIDDNPNTLGKYGACGIATPILFHFDKAVGSHAGAVIKKTEEQIEAINPITDKYRLMSPDL